MCTQSWPQQSADADACWRGTKFQAKIFLSQTSRKQTNNSSLVQNWVIFLILSKKYKV